MSTLRTNNLQNPDSAGVNIVMTEGGGAIFSGIVTAPTLNVTGVLTYDDVTNIDSVGVITARSGVHVTGGNVGIGTDNPGAKTHIDSTTSNTPLVVEASQNNRSRIVFRNNVETGTECNIELFDDDLRFVTNSGERLRIDVNGNVGINEDVPLAKLHIDGSDDAPCLILPDSTNSRYSVGFGNINVAGVGQRLDFYAGDSGSNTTNLTSAARRMSLTSQGRLGIGTINPGENLTVNGSIESLCQAAVGSTEEGGEFIMRAPPQQLTGTKYRYIIDNFYGNGSYGRASNDPVSGIRFVRQDDATSANGLIVCTIDEDGIVRHPYQPIASLSDTRTINLSGVDLNSSNFYNTVWLNQGNHFNASTGRFTCPVAGVYRTYFRCSQNGNALKTNVRLRKNGATINEAYSNSTSDSVSSEIVVQCSAGDYLHIEVAEIHTVGGSQHKQVTFQLLH